MNENQALDRCRSIEGWMFEDELLWLYQQARSSRLIVEIGVWKGRSTTALALGTLGVVYAVDHWLGSPEELESAHFVMATSEGRELVLLEAMRNLGPLREAGRCVPIMLDSAAAQALIAPAVQARGGADMIFLDGSHDYRSVARDISIWRPLVADGGLLCGHDYPWPGVTQAVRELIGPVELGPGSIWSKRL